MKKKYKIILYIFTALMILSMIVGQWNLTIYFIPLIFLFIFLGIFCFERQTLKPIYISFIVGLIFGTLASILTIYSLCAGDRCQDALGAAAFVVFALPAGIFFFLLPLIIGMRVSYKKTKNKIVFWFIIPLVIIFILVFLFLVYMFYFIYLYTPQLAVGTS